MIVHACYIAECVATKKVINFGNKSVEYFREKVVNNIFNFINTGWIWI